MKILKIFKNRNEVEVGRNIVIDSQDYIIRDIDLENDVVIARKPNAKGGRAKVIKISDLIKETKMENKTQKVRQAKKEEVYSPATITDVAKLFEEVRKLTKVSHKVALLKHNVTPEIETLLKWNRKSEVSKGISEKRLLTVVEKNPDIERPKDYDTKIVDFVNDLVANGKRFELTKEEKIKLVGLIPAGMEAVYGRALGKKLALGLPEGSIDFV